MKLKLSLIAILSCFMLNNAIAGGNADSLEDDGTKMNLWIPSILVDMATDIAENYVDEEEKIALDFADKIGNINICIREGKYYSTRTDKKVTRKLERMERKNYEELVSVVTPDERVNISIKENRKGKIKRMVVIVDEKDQTYVYLKMNCRISPDDIAKLAMAYAGDI